MAISEMKKLTLLAEKEYFDEVMIFLQSSQSVEVIPISSAIQRNLVNQYHEDNSNNAENLEESSNDPVFELKSNEKEVNQLTNTLEKVEGSIELLEDILPSPGFLAQLTQEKETYSLYEIEEYMEDKDVQSLIDQAEQLEDRINRITNEKESLEQERSFLNRWRSLDFNPRETEDFQMTEVIVGVVNSERNDDFREALSHFNELYIEEISYTEEETIYLIIVSISQAHDIDQTLIRHRFERLNYDYDHLPKEELKRNRQELDEISEKRTQFREQSKKYEQLLKDLKLTEEYLFSFRERVRVSEDAMISEHLFILSGWVEANTLDQQVQKIQNTIGEDNIYTYVDDVKENEEDDVPIKYDNRKSTSAFEGTVSMYSTPKYNEMDPSPFVQPFSILFFGMMTADAGYGLLGLVAVFLALKFMDFSSGMKKNLEFFGQLMIGTTLAGLFFGSFFGFELPFQVLSLTDDLIVVMVMSIAIGIVHLLLGLFLNTVLNNRRNNYAESYIDGYSWILILLAVSGIAINAYLGGPAIGTTIGVAVILLSLVAVVLVSIFSNESKLAGLGQGLFSLFDVTSYIGDVISYTRLAALGVASANIGMAFNLIIGILPIWARFTIGILIFIALHLFNMFIAMISGYVHMLRLNYVEFFGKFYEGGGREFVPIPMLEKHILIKDNFSTINS